MSIIFKETVEDTDGSVRVNIPAKIDGENIPMGNYLLHLDYEGNDEFECMQLTRKVIVGSGAKLRSRPIIRKAYTTTASTNSTVTTAEKENTHISFNVTVSDIFTNEVVPNFDIYVAFGNGDNTNYFEGITQSDLSTKYFASKKIGKFTTNDNGVANIQFDAKDCFDGTVTSGEHSLYLYLRATSDRTEKNYASQYDVIPFILGDVPVKEVTFDVLNEYKTCGHGTVRVDVKYHYGFAYTGNNVKTGYTAYTNASNTIKKGYIKLLQSLDGGSTYQTVPTDLLDTVTNSLVTLDENGKILLDSAGNTTSFTVKNTRPLNYTGTVLYQLNYYENAGDTRPLSNHRFTVQIDPSYASYTKMKVDIALVDETEPIYMIENNGKSVKLGVYLKDDEQHNDAIDHGSMDYLVE